MLSFETVDASLEPDRLRVFELLRLAPERNEATLLYGGRACGDDEVAVLTRSLQALLGELGAGGLESKRTFMFLLIFASLVETGGVAQAPLPMIPTR